MSERDDEALGVRVREVLDAVRVEPDVGFERRMREGADAVRSARRARRAAGLALVAAGAAGALIWMFDRPQKRLDRQKPHLGVTFPQVVDPIGVLCIFDAYTHPYMVLPFEQRR